MSQKYMISLEAARVNAKMTQEDVARKMKVSRSTIINWENGKVEMKPAQFNMYCEVVNVPRDIISLPVV